MHIAENASTNRLPTGKLKPSTLLLTAMLVATLAICVTAQAQTTSLTKPSVVITPRDAARFYGDANPAFNGRVVGLASGDTIIVTYATVANSSSSVGSYDIIATVSDPNNVLSKYNVTINIGTLSVDPAPLSVVANDVTRASGLANPTFSGTVTGVKNLENITATFNSTATSTSPAGTYAIVPTVTDGSGTITNYALTVSNGTLTVTP
jgi:hypothetical protein